MQKKIGIIICLILCLFCCNKSFARYGNYDDFAQPEEIKTENTTAIIPADTFFRGFIGQTVSSEFNNSGDIIKILITSDFILNNEVLIPANTFFVGMVKNLEKAQQGMDGYFSIDIIGIVFPDGKQYQTEGYIINSKNGKVFGGNFSRRSGHKTTLHRSACFGRKGVLQLQQDGPRIMGKETKIKMGEVVTIILQKPIIIETKQQ